MFKNKKIILIILITLSLLGLFFYVVKNSPPPSLPLIKGEEKGGGQIVKTENKINYAVLEIEGQKYVNVVTGEISIYDFMNDFRKKGVIDFTEKDYTGMGKFIESINGIKRDRNHSWIFYVNNKKSGLGVSNYQIRSGDVVSWKYEKNY